MIESGRRQAKKELGVIMENQKFSEWTVRRLCGSINPVSRTHSTAEDY